MSSTPYLDAWIKEAGIADWARKTRFLAPAINNLDELVMSASSAGKIPEKATEAYIGGMKPVWNMLRADNRISKRLGLYNPPSLAKTTVNTGFDEASELPPEVLAELERVAKGAGG